MKGLMIVAAGMAVGLATPCLAEGAKTVQLSKVMLDTESGEVKGKLKGGTLCVFPGKLPIVKQKRSEDYERYDALFSEKMKAGGFQVVSVSGDLFAGEQDKNKADILIGAVMRPDTLNLCSSVNGEKGDLTLAVDWQVFDRRAGSVVASETTTGQIVLEKFDRSGLRVMFDRAFQAALDQSLAHGTVQKLAGAPMPVKAATVAPAPASAAP